jgi:hypothetical protein
MAKDQTVSTSLSETTSNAMTRYAGHLLVLSLTVFIAAFALRQAFFSGIKPVSWDYTPPQNGALEAAFLLLSIENLAAIVSVIAVVFVAVTWWKSRSKSNHRQ